MNTEDEAKHRLFGSKCPDCKFKQTCPLEYRRRKKKQKECNSFTKITI